MSGASLMRATICAVVAGVMLAGIGALQLNGIVGVANSLIAAFVVGAIFQEVFRWCIKKPW